MPLSSVFSSSRMVVVGRVAGWERTECERGDDHAHAPVLLVTLPLPFLPLHASKHSPQPQRDRHLFRGHFPPGASVSIFAALGATPHPTASLSVPTPTPIPPANAANEANSHRLLKLNLGTLHAAHFRTLARTGAGVGDMFAWVAHCLLASHLAAEEEMAYEEDPRVSLVWAG
ncbi:hypothetical protein B0H17DRAFT_1145911 [Mycena rosella]|uniref:Uncharacterized protein n=1 Tax=Mycena rosella TaxID=1033263 RepID=A0AAD7CSB3_MYCRO|nr:hypothetical protein B0H17DRAFT_1145911 [Mycena rosella]